MRHHNKPFECKAPALLFTSINGGTMTPEFSSNPFAGDLANAIEVSKAQHALGYKTKENNPEFTQEMAEKGGFPYVETKAKIDTLEFMLNDESKHLLGEVVTVKAYFSGKKSTMMSVVEHCGQFHIMPACLLCPVQTDEEKLIDKLASIIDSGFEGVEIAKALLANYNITKKD